MKLTYTIILVLFCTSQLWAINASPTDYNNSLGAETYISSTTDEFIFEPSKIAADDSGMIVNSSEGEEETLDSVLGYFIFIFFSVLVIILIDNRNLEKRYKKLVADYKHKD
ncbi:hypothetical protein KORDIASMS9_04717 [Kordia sp. SMS9]|uniref:hypothetical protein n=1 Tax=Kordia sp. SMS9 TaxID=2282170 RepID=UPI000E0DC1AB|nr:hypothetical protein [Kordia sp. SMS9]AXG72443.1 hypothetical protein KORDIASMS9_04717 [Kordia sp. SMS9]